MNNIIKVFMERDDMSFEDAKELLEIMREDVDCGDDPEEVLYEQGLEPDYIFDLLD